MANEQQASESADQGKKGGGIMGKLVIAIFMGVVILTECVLAYIWMPTDDAVARKVQEKLIDEINKKLEADNIGGLPQTEFSEFELGEFSITSHNSATDTSLRVDFTIAGTVLTEDLERIGKLHEQHKHRFRDHVLVQVRNSAISDLKDPALTLIKQQILEKSNKLFGEPVIKEIIFSRYSHLEQ